MLLAVAAIAEFFLTSGVFLCGTTQAHVLSRHYAPTSNVGIARAAHDWLSSCPFIVLVVLSGLFCYLVVINELFYLATGEGTSHFNNVLAL